MGIYTILKKSKEINPKTIMIFKRGKFYETYGRDSRIMAAIFNYRIRTVSERIEKTSDKKINFPSCGFPGNGLSKIERELEKLKLDYMILDASNDYSVEAKSDNGNLNRYDDELRYSDIYLPRRGKIDRICEKLKDNITAKEIDKIIKSIEEIVINLQTREERKKQSQEGI